MSHFFTSHFGSPHLLHHHLPVHCGFFPIYFSNARARVFAIFSSPLAFCCLIYLAFSTSILRVHQMTEKMNLFVQVRWPSVFRFFHWIFQFHFSSSRIKSFIDFIPIFNKLAKTRKSFTKTVIFLVKIYPTAMEFFEYVHLFPTVCIFIFGCLFNFIWFANKTW